MPCPICAKRQQAKYFYSYEDSDDMESCFGFDKFANGYTNKVKCYDALDGTP